MTPLEQMHRGFGREALVQVLFEELNVSQQCVTGDGGYILGYAIGPDDSFYTDELGFGPRNAEADVLHTSLTLRSSNAARKRQLKKDHKDQQRALKFSAKRMGLRPVLEPYDEPAGCSGCASCVPGARVAPRRIKIAGSLAGWRASWTPGSLPRELRERHAVVGLLMTAAASIRRARKQERSEAYKARKERRAEARRSLHMRRDEEKAVRRAARRALGAASTTRR